MKKIIIVLFLFAQYINAADKVRNYDEQINFIFYLSNKFKVTEIGTISYPNNNYKLYKITYGIPNKNNKKNYLFISGVHGNEIAPIYGMKEFIQYLDSIKIINDIKIDFIYILNPYGFEYNVRHNGNGIDLNRDFINFETYEIKYFINNTKEEKYSGMYDFHEHSATTGFLLYYYSNKNKRLANNILEILQNNNIPLENDYVDAVLKTKNGAIFVPFYAKLYFMNINKQATSGLFFDKINVKEVFVFETPRNMEMAKRIKIVDILLKYLVGI
ncbi:MAG: DUF2817 domain-containing protein [Treponema sp.]|jgi:hypothetical protein|nr:DUF2817 domain-containing protein [Treponema sp.]